MNQTYIPENIEVSEDSIKPKVEYDEVSRHNNESHLKEVF